MPDVDDAFDAGCRRRRCDPAALNALLDGIHVRGFRVGLHGLDTIGLGVQLGLARRFGFCAQPFILAALAVDLLLAPSFGLEALGLLAGLFFLAALLGQGLALALSLGFFLGLANALVSISG